MGWKTLMLLVVVLAGIGSAYAYNWEWQYSAITYQCTDMYLNFSLLPNSPIVGITTTIIDSPLTDNGTINLNDTVSKHYIVNNVSGLTPGGVYFTMELQESGGVPTIVVTVKTDNCTSSTSTTLPNGLTLIETKDGYTFGGTLVIDGKLCPGMSIVTPGKSEIWYFNLETGEWSDSPPPAKVPIPPLATILVLITIPAIVLRKITK
jgi:hypothetical protein